MKNYLKSKSNKEIEKLKKSNQILVEALESIAAINAFPDTHGARFLGLSRDEIAECVHNDNMISRQALDEHNKIMVEK